MKSKFILFLILCLAAFFRFYRLGELMNFSGDVARDYLTARDITLKGIIPLVGCPSSVPWLHQGVFFIYILGLVLWVGKYNPLAGGYFVGLFGVLGALGVFLLGRKLFSKEAGLWAALFYAVSPVVVIFDRYPYHQSLISILTMVFIYSLYLGFNKASYFILSAFLFGLLMQLELSNLVLLPVMSIVIWKEKGRISLQKLGFCFFAFFTTWLPKIIYDFSNGWTQTFGFVAWTIHKIIPVSFPGDNPSANLPFLQRFTEIFNLLSKMIYWPNKIVSAVIFLFLILFFLKGSGLLKEIFKGNIKKRGEFLVALWLIFPFLGFVLHGSPSAAYMPVLFALPSLLTGYFIWKTSKSIKIVSILAFILLVAFNGFFLLKNDFMVTAVNGQPYQLNFEMAKYIADKARGEKFTISSLGKFADFSSNKDTFEYLTWYLGKRRSGLTNNSIFFIYYNFDEARYNSLKGERRRFPYMTVVRGVRR